MRSQTVTEVGPHASDSRGPYWFGIGSDPSKRVTDNVNEPLHEIHRVQKTTIAQNKRSFASNVSATLTRPKILFGFCILSNNSVIFSV